MKLLITTQVVDKHHPVLGFFHRWIEEFAAHFERIDIICLEEGQHSLPDHVHIHSLGKERGVSKLRYLRNFYRHFSKALAHKPEYVLFHMGAILNILAAPYLLKRHRPQFYWWKTHGQLGVKDRLAFWFVDRVYTAAVESFPIASVKRHVVGHAIDTNQFSLKEGERPVDILFVGRFSRVKRIEQVVEVAKLVRANFPQLSVVIVGSVTDPTYYQEIRSLISTYGLDATIQVREPVTHTELPPLYQSAKVFFNPSEHEGLDKVILEAMAAGSIPVTGNTATRELLDRHGLLLPKGDIGAFAATITTTLNMSSTEREALARTLRQQVETKHSILTLTNRIFSS